MPEIAMRMTQMLLPEVAPAADSDPVFTTTSTVVSTEAATATSATPSRNAICVNFIEFGHSNFILISSLIQVKLTSVFLRFRT